MNINDAQLLETLRNEIKKTLAFIGTKEKILSKSEGEIYIKFPSPLDKQGVFSVKIDSYLIRNNEEWTGKTIQEALQKAISDVRSWYQFERDLEPLSNLSRNLLNEYM